MKSVVVDPGAYDWEGDAPLEPPVRATRSSTRCTSRGFTRASELGRATSDARHLRRPDREDPVSAGARHHRGGTAAGVSVRRAATAPPGQDRTTGATRRSRSSPRTRHTARGATRSARSTSFATWSRRCTAPASRSFSTSSSTTRPKATHTARRSAFAASTIRPTTSSTADAVALRQLHRLRQHAQRQSPDRAADDHRQPALLGARDARRRLPLRPGVDPRRATQSGQPLPNPPVLWDIESDPVLAGTKLIAEAWDAAGLYQVGSFVGDAWKEWNGRFRDDVRSFFRGDDRHRCAASRTACSAAPKCTATRSASRSRASISSPATTASR